MNRLSICRIFWICLPGLLFSLAGCNSKHQPLTQEVYVWQRVWTPAVLAGIERSKAHFSTYVVLAGEISWARDEPVWMGARVDYASLLKTGVKVGLALRIGPYAGPFRADDSATKFIKTKVRQILTEARAGGVETSELQIDFDCAQAKLAGYRVWVTMIQSAVGNLPVSITVLPSWLGESDFRPLARTAGRFILQVHSVQKPLRLGENPRIFDPVAAAQWIGQAEKTGTPFRVALPTYTNQVLSDIGGQIVGVTSEDAPAALPNGLTARFARTEAREVAVFLQKLRPERHLRGFIWYRLPLETDRLNWRWQTLQAILDGQPLREAVEVRISGRNPADLSIFNTGNVDTPPPAKVRLDWSSGQFVTGDALPGWTLEHTERQAVFRSVPALQDERLPPGEKMAIGWLRLDSPQKIHEQTP